MSVKARIYEVLAHEVNIWKPASQDVLSRATKTQFSNEQLETNYFKNTVAVSVWLLESEKQPQQNPFLS